MRAHHAPRCFTIAGKEDRLSDDAAEFNLDGFEEFDRSAAPAPVNPFVTIQKRGLLSLNRGAYEALSAPQAVTLMFNRERRVIALRPSDPGSPRSYPVRIQGGQGGGKTYLVAATAFAGHYGLDVSVSRRYAVTVRDGVLFIDLTQDAPEVTGARSKDREKQGQRERVTAAA